MPVRIWRSTFRGGRPVFNPGSVKMARIRSSIVPSSAMFAAAEKSRRYRSPGSTAIASTISCRVKAFRPRQSIRSDVLDVLLSAANIASCGVPGGNQVVGVETVTVRQEQSNGGGGGGGGSDGTPNRVRGGVISLAKPVTSYRRRAGSRSLFTIGRVVLYPARASCEQDEPIDRRL